jgi:hypothetical protein
MCGIIAKNIRGLSIHQNICNGINPLTCQYCKQKFSSKQTKHIHISQNRCPEKRLIENNKKAIIIKEHSNEETKDAFVLIKNDPTTHNEITQINNITTVNNTNNIQNNINNTIINVYALGKEDISYLTDSATMPQFICSVLKNQKDGVCELIRAKHFNPEHPENHNIKKLRKHDRAMFFHNGQDWQRKESCTLIKLLLKKAMLDLCGMVDKIVDHGQEIPHKIADDFMKNIGEALDVDFTGDDYDYEYTQGENEKEKLHNQMVQYLEEYMYDQSKLVHN